MADSCILTPGVLTGDFIAPAQFIIRKGGTMCMVGVGAHDKRTLPIAPSIVTTWQKTITGALFGDSRFQTDIPRYIQLYEEGRINLDDMVTKELTLEEINTGFQNVIAGNKVARQVICF